MKLQITTIVATLALSTTMAMAQNAPENFGGQGGAWDQTEVKSCFRCRSTTPIEHYTNANNPDLRMDWETGRRAVPGNAATAQANNGTDNDSLNSVISRPGSTLVSPW
ncbi:MAG: hypothetical protein HUJ27_11780 [Rhodobacteraceae bacterium]|nr:hypothetical protein [Paracoccaceae bacterium]